MTLSRLVVRIDSKEGDLDGGICATEMWNDAKSHQNTASLRQKPTTLELH